jgi:exonuclease III
MHTFRIHPHDPATWHQDVYIPAKEQVCNMDTKEVKQPVRHSDDIWVLSLRRTISDFLDGTSASSVTHDLKDNTAQLAHHVYPDSLLRGVTHSANGSPVLHPAARGAVHRPSNARRGNLNTPRQSGIPEDPHDNEQQAHKRCPVPKTNATLSLEECTTPHEQALTMITMNVGNSIGAFGDIDDATLKRAIAEANATQADVVFIQEHKLHPESTNCIPYIESIPEWNWTGSPAIKERQQGLGFLTRDYVTILHLDNTSVDKHEAILLIVLIDDIKVACINVYWDWSAHVTLTEANVRVRTQTLEILCGKAQEHGANITVVSGDTNLNIKDNDDSRTRALSEGLGCQGCNLRRLDAEPTERLDWVTRPRTGTHIDMICISNGETSTLTVRHLECWNRNWGNDDHTSLGLKIQTTVDVPCATDNSNPTQWHRIRYHWEKATDQQKQLYKDRLHRLILAGISRTIEKHQATPIHELPIAERRRLASLDACLITAAMHRAARDSNIPRKPNKAVANRSTKAPNKNATRWKHVGHRVTIKQAQVENTPWELINAMRQRRKAKLSVHTHSVHINIPSQHDPKKKTSLFGVEAVARATLLHGKAVSEQNLTDEQFDSGFAMKTQDAITDILEQEAESKHHNSTCGETRTATGGGLDAAYRANHHPPTQEELQLAKANLTEKLEGAPGVDDIMAWMVLWGPPVLWTTLLALFSTMWSWEIVAECWKLGHTKYIPKSGCKDPYDIALYRPLTLRAILGKLYTQILLTRLNVILHPHIPKSQFAYQAQMSSDLALWTVRMSIMEQVVSHREVWVLLCDWAKCFDKVWRELVLLIIHAHGVRGKLWLAVHDWINGTTIVACFLGVTTKAYSLDLGLGQGCVLSALLFVFWMSTLTEEPPATPASYPYLDLLEYAFSASLPRERGVLTALHPTQQEVPAVILADDATLLSSSKHDMTKLVDALQRWMHICRAVANVSKFQLMVLTPKNRARAMDGATDPHFTIKLGTHTVRASLTVKLLGGILHHPEHTQAAIAHYTSRAAAHRSTLCKIDATHGRDVALLYAKACPEAQIIAPAAMDPSMHTMHDCLNQIQRSLWSGAHTAALGTHPRAKAAVVQRLIPTEPWSIAVRTTRLLCWRRLLTNTKPGSWPHYMAETLHSCDARTAQSYNWLMRIDEDTKLWWSPEGKHAKPPVPYRTTAKRIKLINRSAIYQNGPHARDDRKDHLQTEPLPDPNPALLSASAELLDLWQRANYTGSALTHPQADVTFNVLMEQPLDPWEHQACVDPTELPESLKAQWATDNEDATLWLRSIRERARLDTDRAHAREQARYQPSNRALGRGEMALWNRLFPDPTRSLAVLFLPHRRTTAKQRANFNRILAGCILTSKAWTHKRCRTWTEHTHLTSVTEIECPCGLGPQDSVHCLECTLPEVTTLHTEIRNVCLATLQQAHVTSWARSRQLPKDASQSERRQAERTASEGKDALALWNACTDMRQLEGSLGAEVLPYCSTQLVLEATVPLWSKLERLWE